MLILPPGHAQEIRAPRRSGVRERWMVGLGALLTAALIAFAVVSITSKDHTSGHGCVAVTIPYGLGGQQIYDCGAAARALCQEVGVPGGWNGSAGHAVATECRKAGVPVA
jgi:hypothetical protein